MIAGRATLALLVRSLREDSRAFYTYAARFALVGILFLGLIQAYTTAAFVGAPGKQLFSWIAWVDMVFISLAAVSYFATPITEEKEEETLGLLRMTSLNAMSILLGKAGTRLTSTLLLLFAQIPFTLLSITLGGVGPKQIAAAYATLLAFVVFVSALGLLCSVFFQRSREASGAMVLLLLAVGIGPWILRGIIEAAAAYSYISKGEALYLYGVDLCQWGIDFAPWSRLASVMVTGFDDVIFGYQVISNLAAAIGLYALAWVMFDRWSGATATPGPQRLGSSSKKRLAKRRVSGKRAWQSALAWKDYRFIGGGTVGFVGRIFVYALGTSIVYALARWGNSDWSFDAEHLGQIAMSITFAGFLLETVGIAGRVYAEEIRWKTLGSIVILPTSLQRLAYEKLLGCSITLIPCIAIFLLGAILAPDTATDMLKEIFSEGWPWMMAIDFLVLLHLIVLLSLYLKWGAVAAAMAMMFAMHMTFGMVVSLLSFVARLNNIDDDVAIALLIVLGLIACIVMHVWAGRRLAHQGAQ